MQLGLALQLIDVLLVANRGEAAGSHDKERALLQPLLLRAMLMWGVEPRQGVRWWTEAHRAAERLLSWSAAVAEEVEEEEAEERPRSASV